MTSLVGWFHDAGRANVGESRNGTLRENSNRYRSRATTPKLRCRRTKTAVAADARTPKNGRLRESTRRSVVCGPKDRKSTRLNSSHANISDAVFCFEKKNNTEH